MFANFEMFRSVFLNITDDYGAMVLNSQVKSKEITDKVFWYKAGKNDSFIVGSKFYKQYHQKNFNKDWKKKQSGITINDKFSFKLDA